VSSDEVRHGVSLTNLDQPLFEGAGAVKRDPVHHLDAVADRIIPVLRDRPLSVIRVLRGQCSQVHPAVGGDRVAVGGEFAARGLVCAMR
jgi:DNA primase